MDQKTYEWPSDWLRAILPLVSLSILDRGPAHGYAILQALESMGLGSIRGGTLYPLLARQQELGRIEHRWETSKPGPARKVFDLTARGRRELTSLADAWKRLEGIVSSAMPDA
jgi:PadR family transcriptional regulator, regulatory protein PadR